MHEDHEALAAEADDTRSDLLAPRGGHHAGKIHFAPEPEAAVQEPQAFYPLPVDDVLPHDEVILYGTVVTITGEPFKHSPLDGRPCHCHSGGYVHVPMIWDGEHCTTAERSGALVAVSRPGHG